MLLHPLQLLAPVTRRDKTVCFIFYFPLRESVLHVLETKRLGMASSPVGQLSNDICAANLQALNA